MTFFHRNLQKAVLISILQEWISLIEFVSIDGSLTSKSKRAEWRELLPNLTVTVALPELPPSSLAWILKRGIKLDVLKMRLSDELVSVADSVSWEFPISRKAILDLPTDFEVDQLYGIIQECRELRHLVFRDFSPIGECRALAKMVSKLQTFELSGWYNGSTEPMICRLLKSARNLTKLKVLCNEFVAEFPVLAHALEGNHLIDLNLIWDGENFVHVFNSILKLCPSLKIFRFIITSTENKDDILLVQEWNTCIEHVTIYEYRSRHCAINGAAVVSLCKHCPQLRQFVTSDRYEMSIEDFLEIRKAAKHLEYLRGMSSLFKKQHCHSYEMAERMPLTPQDQCSGESQRFFRISIETLCAHCSYALAKVVSLTLIHCLMTEEQLETILSSCPLLRSFTIGRCEYAVNPILHYLGVTHEEVLRSGQDSRWVSSMCRNMPGENIDYDDDSEDCVYMIVQFDFPSYLSDTTAAAAASGDRKLLSACNFMADRRLFFELLDCCDRIYEAVFRNVYVTDVLTLMIYRFPSLVNINIENCPITDGHLLYVARECRQLRSLELSECNNITNDGMTDFLTQCALHLEYLEIGGCKLITGEIWAEIWEDKPILKELQLKCKRQIISKDEVENALKSYPQLRYFRIEQQTDDDEESEIDFLINSYGVHFDRSVAMFS